MTRSELLASKGGVGKTTTALDLARRLAERKLNILLVDFDSQSNSTQTLPNPHGDDVIAQTLADYFDHRAQLSALIRPTHLPNLFIIPCSPEVRLALNSVKPGPAEELRFAESLHANDIKPPAFMANTDFDWIIIVITPPDMTFRVRAALAASHYVVAPFEAGPDQSSGLQQLYDTILAIQGLLGTRPNLLGCLLTRWQENKPNKDSVKDLDNFFLQFNHIPLFATIIKFDANIQKDEGGKFHLLSLGQKPAAQQYTEFTEEVFEQMSATLTTSKRLTTQQRVNGATAQLQSLIGASDVKLLSAAITEAAAAEAVHNPTFRQDSAAHI